MRMDKYLWAARFFKTRSIATHACELGRIESNGITAKPAREVRVGDRLKIKNEAGLFEIEVLELSEMRGPAAVAQALYSESEASKAARAAEHEARKAQPMFDRMNDGKISKRDRRDFDRVRGR
jgi:ribosome-associated heat shock protein Hsp15